MILAIRSGIVLMGLVATSSFANVVATPSYTDLGAVPMGSSRMARVEFRNFSNQPVSYFNVSCGGDLSVFQCFSMCSTLPAYGSCSVQVQFFARSGDGMRKSVWLNGWGSTGLASATVSARDERPRADD